MIDLLKTATGDLAHFLETNLPNLSKDWWHKHVLDRLSFQQQRLVQERDHKTLKQLDFAALLRVIDQNWYELSNQLHLSREARSWVKELQTVSNKWAHLSSETMPPSEIYRDADTLGRLLKALGADVASLKAVETTKTDAVAAMAGSNVGPINHEQGQSTPADVSEANLSQDTSATVSPTMFKVGDLVTLRSDPNILFPVMDVIPGGAECRYRVFQDNAKTTYYESQLQIAAIAGEERKILTVHELHAHLTGLNILSPSTANLFSLRSGRIKFVPYQYRPVLKLIRADRPRLLIADEVGVGKTIEAGLIIKELKARMDITSILVICPKALVAERKWFTEMKRFDEHFMALDGPLLRHCLKETHLEGHVD